MLPKDFLDRIRRILPKEEYNDFVESYDIPRRQALRINLLKGDYETFKNIAKIDLKEVPWTTTGYYYESQMHPGKSPYHEAGVYYIQEPSAMAPASYIESKPGEVILDLCAAPGGKSTQIASTMDNEGLLVSNEIHPQRAKILAENVERMGIANDIVTNESPDSLEKKCPSFFDKIMVDAPCSGEGMFKKNENATDEWSLENVKICADRQDMILDCAANMLRPGGRIVYSTCTFAPEENEGSIYRFLQRHSDFHIVEVEKVTGMSDGNINYLDISEEDKKLYRDEMKKTIRLWPHKLNGEGHFVAVLEQNSPKLGEKSAKVTNDFEKLLEKGSSNTCKGKKNKKDRNERQCKYGKKSSGKANIDDMSAMAEFFRENIKSDDKNGLIFDGKIISFKEQVYMLPKLAPNITGLKTPRAGLHLGTIKKDRFEPAHALALALKKEQVKNFAEIDYDTAVKFINGETFRFDGEKGWYLITFNGYSLGWGKLSAGVMKNHYPKGLRRKVQ